MSDGVTACGRDVSRGCLKAPPCPTHDNPTPLDLLEQLHRAVHGDVWARPESPAAVWANLINTVHSWRRSGGAA